MVMKDETREPVQKDLKIAYSDNLTGPYSKVSTPIKANFWAEGPTTLIKDSSLIVYFDKYRDHKYDAVSTTDLINWTDISDKISMPKGARHGSVFTVNDEIFNLLREQ